MLTAAENDLMCRVEGDAPMGQIMRYYWMPACLVEEVTEPDGTPLRVRLLGENYVAFRNTNGQLGFLDELCPHRRASLALGRNEECGLRCLYHGWKIDVDGNVIDMPSEPAGSTLMEKVKHKAYPIKEWAGVVWVYLGDGDTIPEFEPPAWAPAEDTKVSIAKIQIPCNWAQIMEGAIDSAHSSSLHSSDMVPARVIEAEADDEGWYRPSTDKSPRIRAKMTESGFHYAAKRRPIKNADEYDYIRTTVFVLPITALIPPNSSYNVANINVPIDDENTMFHFIGWGGEGCPDQDAWRKFLGALPGVDLDENWVSKRQNHNLFLQDRDKMKNGDFTGIGGIPNQDIAMWVTMGAVADRSVDILGASDLAIVEFRRYLLEQAKSYLTINVAYEDHVFRKSASSIVPAWQGVIPKGVDWSDAVEREKHKLLN